MADDRISTIDALSADPALRWENYSTHELRAIIGRGLAGGDEVARAIAETERRARASEASEGSVITAARSDSAGRQQSFRSLIILTLLTIVVAVGFGLWLAT